MNNDLDNPDESCALITGASSGIGWAYAEAIASTTRLSLILTARRLDRLHALKERLQAGWAEGGAKEAGRRVVVIPCDLSRTEARAQLCARVEAEGLKVALLVNNAGFGHVGAFPTAGSAKYFEMVEVNCAAPLDFCRYFLPRMARGSTIINVCSTAAFQAMPYMAVYAATKSFLLNLSVALAVEAEKLGVQVVAHCPGPTNTEFHETAGVRSTVSFFPAQSAAEAVREALAAAKNGSYLIVNGRLNRMLAQTNRLFSRRTAARLVEVILRQAHGREMPKYPDESQGARGE